ncbi:MAG: extracellular solute-binding protein, partial [Clostridia bacterium]|nr:extracellular solute-binding protein [Clostridia bacterium]
MKSVLKKVVFTALGATMVLPFAACGSGENNPGGNGAATTLKVSVYAAGYGTGWIEEACRVYTDNHPDVTFKIEANSRMFDTIKTRLESNTCDSDVVLIANYNYTSLVARGVLEDLSDVYSAVIPDT